jgi:exodeoxyribonuclease V beta subunit
MTLALTLPLRGNQLIEASAGTGKTYTIALVYVRLILEGLESLEYEASIGPSLGRLLLPPDILVLTFTRAAAGELRARIRERLVDSAGHFAGDHNSEPDAATIELMAQYDSARHHECARRLTLASTWMDSAAISTIDAWVLKMLQEHAFESGSSFALTMEINETQRKIEAVRDYWRTHIANLDLASARLIYGNNPKDPDALLTLVGELLNRPHAITTFEGEVINPGQVHTSLMAMLTQQQAVFTRKAAAQQAYLDDSTISDVLLSLRDLLNGNTFKNVKQAGVIEGWLAELDHWANSPDANEKFVRKLGRAKIKLSKKQVLPDNPFFDRIDDWLSADDAAQNAQPRLTACIQVDAAHWVRNTLKRNLSTDSATTFSDALQRLDTALQGEQGDVLAQRIREQFPIALIDEFQDTDPVQYQIFAKIYRVGSNSQDTGIILIGDPKQAIYSFRGADIFTYLKARTATAEHLHTLDTNFRSTTPMVNAVNHLFEHAEQSPNSHPKGTFRYQTAEGNPVPFTRVAAKGRNEQLMLGDNTATALNVWVMDIEAKAEPYRDAVVSHTAEQIVTWLNDSATGFKSDDGFRRLQPADIAILVRSGTEASAMGRALRARDLPSVYLSEKGSVFETDEAQDVLRWLTACVDPSLDRQVREALATRTLALSLTQLDALRDDELLWESHQQHFVAYQQQWSKQGVLPMLNTLIHDYGVPQTLLRFTDGERRMTNLLHLMEWLQNASQTLDGEHALIRALTQQLTSTQKQENVLRLESDSALIQIVTIHKSKGLEYPLVLMPFAMACKVVKAGDSKSFRYQDENALGFELGNKKNAPDAYDIAEEERLREDIRLVYVALTRARHATFIGVAENEMNANESALAYLLGGNEPIKSTTDLNTQLVSLAADAAPGVIDITSVSLNTPTTAFMPRGSDVQATDARTPQHPTFPRWWVASYSALTSRLDETSSLHQAETQADANRDESGLDIDADALLASQTPTRPKANTIHSFPRGAEPGTFLHGLIEWAGEQPFARSLTHPARTTIIERRLRVRGWLKYTAIIDEWLQTFLTTGLPVGSSTGLPVEERKTMALDQLQHYQVEQDFSFPVHDVYAHQLDSLITQNILPNLPRRALGPNALNGLMTGFIDMVAEHDGRYYVVDWKSNYLGPTDADYTQQAMSEVMTDKRYDVQLCLYLTALHRHLRHRLKDYDYDKHIGGALFVFLRGIGNDTRGVFHHKPNKAFIEALDTLMLTAATPITAEAEAVAQP